MAKNVKRIILSEKQPNNKHIAWAKPSGDNIDLKIFEDNKWKPVAGGASSTKRVKYSTDPNSYLLTEETTFQDLESLYRNSIISELNLPLDDRSWTEEQMDLYLETLYSKFEQTPFRTEDHGMAKFQFEQSPYGGYNTYFKCDDGSYYELSDDIIEHTKEAPFKISISGIDSAKMAASAKVLDISDYFPDASALFNAISNLEGLEGATFEESAKKELFNTEFYSKEHGSAELLSYGSQGLFPGDDLFRAVFKCEDGTIIAVDTSSYPPGITEFPPISNHYRYLLISDSYAGGLRGGNVEHSYYIIDTKNTYGEVTEKLKLDAFKGAGIDPRTVHLYTDTIYVPDTSIITSIDSSIAESSDFFKLYNGAPSVLPTGLLKFVSEINYETFYITESTTIESMGEGINSTEELRYRNYLTFSHGPASIVLINMEDTDSPSIHLECSDHCVAIVTNEGTTFTDGSGLVIKSPLKRTNDTIVGDIADYLSTTWITTVKLTNGVLAYIFLEISSAGDISINNTLFYSDDVLRIPEYDESGK